MVLTREQIEQNFRKDEVPFFLEELGGDVLLIRPSAETQIDCYARLKPFMDADGNIDPEEHKGDPEFTKAAVGAFRPLLLEATVDASGAQVFAGDLGQSIYNSLDVETLGQMVNSVPAKKKTKPTDPKPKQRKRRTTKK